MNQKTFFKDRGISSLEYTATETVDASFEPSEAETVSLDSHWNDFFGTDEYVKFRATVAQPIVQPYFYDGELQRFKKDEDELKQAQAQNENLPWTVDHPPDKRITTSEQIRGFWSEPQWNDGQVASLHIPANDTDGIRYAVNNDEVSVGFAGALEWTNDGVDEYDAVQRDMAYDHIASVESGRCGQDQGCGLHSDSDEEIANHGVATDGVATTVNKEQTKTASTNDWSAGDFVKYSRNDDTYHGKLSSVDRERSLVKQWNQSTESFAQKSTMVGTSNLREWVGPFVDTCSGDSCSCGCHIDDSVSQSNDNVSQSNDDVAQNDKQTTNTTMTDSLHDFIDEHDLTEQDVIDRLGIETPNTPTDFYDTEPSVGDLREDFTAVESLADSKESLETEVSELNDELQEYRTEQFRDSAERLCELVDRDIDVLVEQFEDGELTVEQVEDKISVAEDAIGSSPTTVGGGNDDETDSTLVADNDGTVNDTDIDRTQGGRYNLSSHDI